MHPLFIKYCAYFNGNQDYFECHEVLEELWKELKGNKQHILVGYIQIAASMYHWRRGNLPGAIKLMKNAIKIVENSEDTEFTEDINISQLVADCKRVLEMMKRGNSFEKFTIVITNKKLFELVKVEIASLPTVDEIFLLNKHILRER